MHTLQRVASMSISSAWDYVESIRFTLNLKEYYTLWWLCSVGRACGTVVVGPIVTFRLIISWLLYCGISIWWSCLSGGWIGLFGVVISNVTLSLARWIKMIMIWIRSRLNGIGVCWSPLAKGLLRVGGLTVDMDGRRLSLAFSSLKLYWWLWSIIGVLRNCWS